MKIKNLLKKLHPIMFAFFYIFFLLSCNKENFPNPATLPKGLTGSWVEVHTYSDTLVFTSEKDTGSVLLKKGYEIRNGYRLPTIGTTIYSYVILSGSIKMIDGLSSTWAENYYYFNFDEQNLIINIGKFSKYIDTQKTILTFRKIK